MKVTKQIENRTFCGSLQCGHGQTAALLLQACYAAAVHRCCFCVGLQGQMLFNSWEDLVNGAGGYFNDNTPLYSFDGKDVMNDSMWSVEQILLLFAFFFFL